MRVAGAPNGFHHFLILVVMSSPNMHKGDSLDNTLRISVRPRFRTSRATFRVYLFNNYCVLKAFFCYGQGMYRP